MATNQEIRRRDGAAVYETLREMAIEYRFRPNEEIREADVAERLGVSRTPVRDALWRLEGEGLVVFRRNHGFRCRSLSVAEIADHLECARSLEASLIPRLLRADDDQVIAFRHAAEGTLNALDVLPACDRARAYEAFHNGLADLSGNKVAAGLLRSVNAGLRFIRKTQMDLMDDPRPIFVEHVGMARAVELRQPDQLGALIETHNVIERPEIELLLERGLGRLLLAGNGPDVNLGS